MIDNNANYTNYSFAFDNCALTQASVDNILVSIDSHGTSGSNIDVGGGTSSAPGAAGAVAKANLQARGWTVNTN
jgi:hypothetical protein